MDAHTRIRGTCEQAFNLVDADGSRFVDLQQTKTALLLVFQQLKGELPQPYEYWYELVFRNFDRDRDGLIHINDFMDIVTQYYDHYQARQAKMKLSNRDSEASMNAANSSEGPESPTMGLVTHSPTTEAPPPNPPMTAVPAAMQHYATSVQKATPKQIITTATSAKNAEASLGGVPLLASEYGGKLAIFDDYEFFDKAGQGSFGKVLVVRHKATKQVRACKAVTVRGQSQAELIHTEIQTLRLLDHPNILKLFETYYDGTNMYLISELCEGGSLQDRINFHYPKNPAGSTISAGAPAAARKSMGEGLVALIMQQLLGALAVCHSRSIIHRDIKPENILFVTRAKESPLKLIDFGLATTLENAYASARELKIRRKGFIGALSKAIPACVPPCIKPYSVRKIMPRAGTLNYFSPEMIRGEYTELTDVFSAGIILYQLLTGVHPFYVSGVDDENSVKFKISKREADFPLDLWNHISADAKDLTRKLLMRDPNYRISAINALKHRWFKDPLKPTLHGNSGGGGVTQSIFEGLREFNQSTRLKQILLKMLARELTEIQTQDLRKKFLSLDKSGDGKISRDDLINGMKSIGISPGDIELLLPPVNAESAFNTVISYNEFLAALSERKVKYGKTQLREAFKKLDIDNSGIVSIENLQSIIRASLQVTQTTSIEDSQIYEVMFEAGILENDLIDGLTFTDFSDIVSIGYITRDTIDSFEQTDHA